MAEYTLDLGRTPASSTPSPSPAPPPIAAAAPPAPAAAAPRPSSGRGPHNNWGQQPVYAPVTAKPPDYDHSKTPTKDAPHGFKLNGDPWSPYGTTENRGKIRTRPVPEMKDRDPCARAQAGVAGERRAAASDLKAPASVIGLYGAIDDEQKRLVELVQEVKRQHPESKYGIPPHPKSCGDGTLALASPHFGRGGIADVLKGVTGFLSKKLGDPDAKPSKETIEEAAEKIEIATKYYGINTDPKTTATVVALVAILFVLLPSIMSGLGKLIDKVRGDKEEAKS
jgi:hypothetical protein